MYQIYGIRWSGTAYALYEGMRAQRLLYAVIEVDLDGKINLGVSHWHFDNITDAIKFANEIGSNNPECKFHVVTLMKGK